MPLLSSPAPVQLEGLAAQPLRLSAEGLRALPRVDLGPTDIVCMTGRLVSRAEGFAGVRLKAVLEQAGLGTRHRAELKQTLVLCHGADGYRVIFSWYELFNTAVGEQVLLVTERDGQALGTPADGEVALISAADTFRGPRHLHRLARIEILRLPD
jgi:DMSO/TMAO reductase YedYZ molybdopterin-dependent catalytic subunit